MYPSGSGRTPLLWDSSLCDRRDRERWDDLICEDGAEPDAELKLDRSGGAGSQSLMGLALKSFA